MDDITDINIEITSTPVVATTRKLRAIWNIEMAADLKAYYGLYWDSRTKRKLRRAGLIR